MTEHSLKISCDDKTVGRLDGNERFFHSTRLVSVRCATEWLWIEVIAVMQERMWRIQFPNSGWAEWSVAVAGD